MKLILITLFILIDSVISLHLSTANYQLVKNLYAKKEKLDITKNNQLDNIMFSAFKKYANKLSNDFTKKHYYKCQRIPKSELQHYAHTGLYKSIKKYNGKTDFIKFANFYIHNELKLALTDSYSLSILPKYKRMASKKNMNFIEKEKYMQQLKIDTRSNINNWYLKTEKNKIDYEDYQAIWLKINQLDPILKRTFHLKFNFELDKIRSNKEVAELMCCSQETVRKNIHSIIKLKD